MSNVEIALVNLGEVTATELHKSKNTQSVDKLKKDVGIAGIIAGNARKEIEEKIGKSVISKENYLNLNKDKELKSVKEVNFKM